MKRHLLGALLVCAAAASTVYGADITAPGDSIVAIDTSGGTEHLSAGSASPSGEDVTKVIDNLTSTKYLNFQGETSSSGFIIVPLAGSTTVTGFRISTANDAPERDPMTFELYGSNTTSSPGVAGWTLITSGSTGIAADPGRQTAGPVIAFTNTTGYTNYKVLFTSVRSSLTADSMQVSEVELMGTVGANPPSPDLQSGSDTGVSNSDDVTSDVSPTFDLTGLDPSATLVELVRDGVAVASMSGGVTATTLTDPGPVPDGSHAYTARHTISGTPYTSFPLTVTIDTTATVTINQSAGQADPTSYSQISFTIDTNEPVTGLDATDIVLSGTAGATTANVTMTGPTTYAVTVTGMTTSGTVIASVKPGAATDSAGNATAASTSTDNTVTYVAVPAVQTVLYAAEGASFTTANLYRIDPATAAATLIGPVGQALTGLAQDPATGILYGVTNGKSACARCLVTVNTLTGAGTVVGPLAATVADITFLNGTLYGYAGNSGNPNLYTINVATGTATLVGSATGLTGRYGDALAADASGRLFLFPEGTMGSYYRIDPATGAKTLVGPLIGPEDTTCAEPGDAGVAAGSFDPNSGVVYASTLNCGATLIAVNVGTGTFSSIGALPDGIDALAFAVVPTFSINDVSVVEGNAGIVNANFTVTLSSASAVPVTVDFTTMNGTATAPSDYTTTAGTLTFLPGGALTQTVTVPVMGETTMEPDETFTVSLSNATNAGISDATGLGTILNDDASTADLYITKVASPGPYYTDHDVTYTITVTNNGPGAASGVTVTDVLPAGAAFVSATASQGSCSGTTTVTCSIGALANAGTATITLVVTPTGTGNMSNSATVSSTSDPNSGNNVATTAIQVSTVTAVPTLSTWALLMLGMVLVAAALKMRM